MPMMFGHTAVQQPSAIRSSGLHNLNDDPTVHPVLSTSSATTLLPGVLAIQLSACVGEGRTSCNADPS